MKGDKVIEKKNQVLERLRIEYVPVESLTPNQYNPNRQSDHDFELLLRSMREDGFTQPVVAQAANREIVDGEHRWRAAQALGYSEIPVVFVDMTPEQMRIATLRHNRARGSEDIELASSVLRDLQALGALDWAQDSLMLDDVELQRMIEDVPAPDALAAEDWGNSWEPTVNDQDAAHEVGGDQPKSLDTVVTASPGGGVQMQAMSAAAIDAARKRERDLALAKTAEERETIKREASSFFRLMLLYQGREASRVRHVLGDQGAEKLIELIDFWLLHHPEEELSGEPDQVQS